MIARTQLARVAFGSAMLVAAAAVAANGRGGGTYSSAMPSMSASQYDPSVEYRKGLEALHAGHYRDASRAFGRVLRVSPRDANSNFLAGVAYAGLGKLKEAGRYYERAVKYDDSFIRAHQELGVTFVKLGKTDKAEAILEDLRQRANNCDDTCAQAADLRVAIPALEATLSAAPPTSLLSSASDLLFASTDRGDHQYLEAVSLINEGRYEEAIVALDASARVFGPHPDILTYLGFVNRKLGRFEIAEDYYQKALAAAPDHIGATEYYGELMVERGDLAGAWRMLAKLEAICSFGCAQAEELRRWIVAASPDAS